MKNKVSEIEINIRDKEDIYNKFNDNQISEELVKYILINYKKFGLNNNVKIIINNYCGLNDKEKDHLVDSIREYFGLLVRDKMIYIKFNNIKSIVLLIVGIILVLGADLLRYGIKYLIPELLLISGWFAIWEMVDSLLFVDNKNKVEKKIAKKLSKCIIEFEDLK